MRWPKAKGGEDVNNADGRMARMSQTLDYAARHVLPLLSTANLVASSRG